MSVITISIENIGLSVRSVNALHRIDVHTVGQMMEYDEERLLQVRNLGQKSVKEILTKIEEYREKEASGWEPDASIQEQTEEDLQIWLESDSGKTQILEWLQEKQIGIDALEMLSAKAYNLLMLNGREYLCQLVFQTQEDLQKIPRMDMVCAAEIVKWTEEYIRENADEIFAEYCRNKEPVLTLDKMRFMPAYQSQILEFVLKNDISVDGMSISARPKNQLQRNGYHKLSDIIFLTEEVLKNLPSMGSTSVDQIQKAIGDYLKTNESRILAFCNGDVTVLWDDTAIRKKILRLYREQPFVGYSLKDMNEKIEIPAEVSQEQIKKVIGTLLAEQKLEYVDFRCYRLYEKFEVFLAQCDAIDDRSKQILQLRLQGKTLEEIGQEYDVTRERVRQIIKKKTGDVRNRYAMLTGDNWFDEDYYWYFYETYAFERREVSRWMGIPETVWKYLDMMDVKQGKKDLESALDDSENLEIGLRLKVKNYLNRNKIFVDGVWVEKRRGELEPIIAKKFCQDGLPFDAFAKAFNDFLAEEDIPYDEELYYTDAVARTRKNRLADSRFVLWKQNEMIRYYDIDSRDYTELLDTLNLDAYENVEYSTYKFLREYPQLMEKYDIRDQYELHNLLRKIVPEGAFHDFRCGRMPEIKFGTFDRNAAILDILIEMAPVTQQALCQRIHDEYGYDYGITLAGYLTPFNIYYHEGIYSIDHKAMRADRMETLHRMLPEDFYYLDEIRKIYAKLFPDADLEEINPYNLKSMGFIVLSRYVVQHHSSLEAYCEHLFTREDIVDLKPLRQRLTYVQMFSQKLMEMKRSLDVIEFEPGQILHFRKLARAGITKADLYAFCDAVYDFVPAGSYFSIRSLKADGFEAELFDLGFSDWFYANLLHGDDRFSFMQAFNNIVLCKEVRNITIQSFLVDRVYSHGWIDTYDLMTELEERFGYTLEDKWDITYRLKNTQIYYDKILDRLYANVDLYYRDLDEGGF